MNPLYPLLLAASLFAGPEVEVKPLTGGAITGRLELLEEGRLVVRPDRGESVELATRELLGVSFPRGAGAAAVQPTVWVSLVDGGSLAAAGYEVNEGKARIRLAGGGEVELPTRNIERVRLKEQDEALAAQWAKIPSQRPQGDIIVIRKPFVDEATGDTSYALDYLEGHFRDVTAESVGFEFDGSLINVKRERVEGLIYYRVLARNFPEPTCEVIAADGSRWRARELTWGAEGVEVATLAGDRVTLPAESLDRFDYSLGKIVYLSDLEPLSVQSTPGLQSTVATSSLLQLLYTPQRDRSFEGPGLRVAGRTYDKGIALQSRTEVVYRLPGEYARVVGLAGIDDRAGDGGNVQLVISADGRVVFDQRISSGDPPVEIDLPLGGATRVKVLVDFGDNLDNADQLNLCEMRVVK